MKHLSILIICLLFCTSAVHAGWFSNTSETLAANREKIMLLENQLSAQYQYLSHWKLAAGLLLFGCVLLLIIGTALGAETRKHYADSERMGETPVNTTLSTTAPIDGSDSPLVGEIASEDDQTSLET